MSIVSAREKKLASSGSLSRTLAPPTTTTYGRSGVREGEPAPEARARPGARRTRAIASGPRRSRRGPDARVPNASSTNSSPRRANRAAKPGSLASSPGWNRRFSSSRNWPFSRRVESSSASIPTTSLARGTGCPRSELNRWATGRRLSLGSRLPSGRPRWDMRMVRAPAARRWFRVGRASTIRRSSATWPVASCGTLKSTRTSTRRPRTGAPCIPRFASIRAGTRGAPV